MLIKDSKMFGKGCLLMGSFLVVLFIMFMPWFGEGKNALEFSDEFFNELSKGSSDFSGEITKKAGEFAGKTVTLMPEKKATIPDGAKGALKAEDVPAKTAEMLKKAGFDAQVKDGALVVPADLGKLIAVVVKDSQAMFAVTDEKAPFELNGMNGKVAMTLWWNLLSNSIKPLQKEGKVAEATLLDLAIRKGIEPAYNFFGVKTKSVMSSAGVLLAGLLIFYVIYTMWYGYAIFDLFGGIGLTMKKSKVKKES